MDRHERDGSGGRDAGPAGPRPYSHARYPSARPMPHNHHQQEQDMQTDRTDHRDPEQGHRDPQQEQQTERPAAHVIHDPQPQQAEQRPQESTQAHDERLARYRAMTPGARRIMWDVISTLERQTRAAGARFAAAHYAYVLTVLDEAEQPEPIEPEPEPQPEPAAPTPPATPEPQPGPLTLIISTASVIGAEWQRALTAAAALRPEPVILTWNCPDPAIGWSATTVDARTALRLATAVAAAVPHAIKVQPAPGAVLAYDQDGQPVDMDDDDADARTYVLVGTPMPAAPCPPPPPYTRPVRVPIREQEQPQQAAQAALGRLGLGTPSYAPDAAAIERTAGRIADAIIRATARMRGEGSR